MKRFHFIGMAMIITLALASCGREKDVDTTAQYPFNLPCLEESLDDAVYIRELGISGNYSDSLVSLDIAKLQAYQNLLLRELSNMYPMLLYYYDESIMEDDNVVCATTVKNKDGYYESYVVLEAPMELLKNTLKKAINMENHVFYIYQDGVLIKPRISDSIKKYKENKLLEKEEFKKLFDKEEFYKKMEEMLKQDTINN